MPAPENIQERLIQIAEPVCESAGYELVDLEYRREPIGWVVRVFIDRLVNQGEEGGEPIGFADCETVSRELSAVFDVEDPVDTAYNLEVSSPGVDRPLRKLSHFEAVVGEQVKVVLGHGLDGRRNFKGEVIGTTQDEGGQVQVQVDGNDYFLPVSDVRSAKLIADWDAIAQAQKQAQKREQKRQKKDFTKKQNNPASSAAVDAASPEEKHSVG